MTSSHVECYVYSTTQGTPSTYVHHGGICVYVYINIPQPIIHLTLSEDLCIPLSGQQHGEDVFVIDLVHVGDGGYNIIQVTSHLVIRDATSDLLE